MNKFSGRYDVPTNEDHEPGSNGEVLKNYLNIKTSDKIAVAEAQELKRCEDALPTLFKKDQQLTAENIRDIHTLWLGDIYPIAGKYRTVAMSKDGFLFAAPSRIHSSMIKFENNHLGKYTPCNSDNLDELAIALAIVHVEFIVIHPFREGNGRTARLLADLMSMQAGKQPLNYNLIDRTINEEGFYRYISAIHAGVRGNYKPMITIFHSLLSDTSL